MKKQILILVVIVLAAFANVNKSYGQAKATNNTDANPITCLPDALNPVAGVPYDYSAIINPAGGTAIWHVVYNQTTFITAGTWSPTDEAEGGSFISAATGLGSNANATSPTQATITWKTDGLATVASDKPLFVAIEYTANPATGCNNNLQVFQIMPKNAFTIDIFNMLPDASATETTAAVSQCYSPIAGATYNAGTPGTVSMDYGTNTMYFEVVAANFTGSFSPTFNLSGLQTGQTADVYWGYTPATATTGFTLGTAFTAETNETNTSSGVSIYIKVVIHNGSYEGLTSDPIALAVEAVNSAGQADVLPNCTVPATADQFEDVATQTLNARPAITNTPAPTPFLDKN